VHVDKARAARSYVFVRGFFAMALLFQLLAGTYTPSWWQFPGVLLGAIFSFAVIGNYSLYKAVFVRTNESGEIVPFRRRDPEAA